MIKNFYQFINEKYVNNDFVISLATSVLNRVKNSSKSPKTGYVKIKSFEFIQPLTFDLDLIVSRSDSPSFDSDEHFKNLPWEKINFNNFGFSSDANTYTDSDEDIVPEIEIVLLINPKMEPECYPELYYKLIDIISHELHHLTQSGWNRKPFTIVPVAKSVRDNAKHDYKYFLLPDEIESMVVGMYTRSQVQKKDLDLIFDQYLLPFIEYEYITQDQYSEIIKVWVKYALDNYPEVKFSSKVKEIVNSI